MSYSTIAICAADRELRDRVSSAAAQEGHSVAFDIDYMWQVSSAQDIEAAYASALAGGNESPGGDESVITDGMLLAYVQANPPTPAPAP